MRKNANRDTVEARRGRAARAVGWATLLLLLAVTLAPLPFYLLSDPAAAQATEQQQGGGEQARERQREGERAGWTDENVRANFWREVRQGATGYSAVTGQEANVLIQNGGENWRALREGPIVTYGVWVMGGFLAIIALFYLLRGSVKIDGGRSGMTVQRWNTFERVLHWYTAILFVILAITGLSLLYGRTVLIPVLGKDGFAAYAALAKDLHNYLGPAFALGLLVEIILWFRHNIPKRQDFVWLAKGGGMVGKEHAPAGRMNGGEKIWFWLLCTVGVAMVVAGFVLNFPNFGQTRDVMQLAHLIHVVGGFILIAVALGHIYIGTLGTEGAFEGMARGRVDVAWAKQHHNLWYDELIDQGVQPERATDSKARSEGPLRAEPRST